MTSASQLDHIRKVVFYITVAGLCLSGAPHLQAQSRTGFYLSSGVGLASGAGTETTVTGANHHTRCDRLLYTNPADAPTDPECSGSGSGLDGLFVFDPEAGLVGSLALGYAYGAISLEIEAVQRHQSVHETPLSLGSGAGAAIIGKDSEWSAQLPPWGDISEFRGRQLFVNVYYEFANASAYTPYFGVGGGLARTDYRFYSSYLRKSVADGYLEAFGGSRNNPAASPEWQRRAAGTLSRLDAPVSENALGYMVLGGVDYAISGAFALGVKARWVRVPVISIDQVWQTIRSHAPVHADGATPFESRIEFSKLGYVGATISLKYRL